MDYVHIPTGVKVTSDKELPSSLYKPVTAEKSAPKRKPASKTGK